MEKDPGGVSLQLIWSRFMRKTPSCSRGSIKEIENCNEI